ncbi:hypothetical protein SISNIDRAFT_444940 [Sistotremastrum niveocremeum HHB9708]|uniref:Protein kinase domain-containing protein n=1 Tax=Sistotremastrum niveocremeum HHB9708 TaxID=1314777 RepID=A0A164QHB6_9AGAM|nr:hypothetical protein SISNIDRAFT_444940 [Sistotremastrum niveocremeum HHB9708]
MEDSTGHSLTPSLQRRIADIIEDTPRSAPTTGGVPSATERNESIEPVLRTELADGLSLDADDFFDKILHCDRYTKQQVKRCFTALVMQNLYDDVKKQFDIPSSGLEKDMYPPLIKVINAITKSAKEGGVPDVDETIWREVHRGIQGKDPNHQSIFPDIAGAKRAQGPANPLLEAAIKAASDEILSWQLIGNICEVKTHANKDTDTELHLQLAKYARKVLMYQRGRRRFVLGWTLCGDVVRAWLFDRAGGLSSRSFNYHADPDLFIRMIISLSSMSSEELGYDPTITQNPDGKLILDFTYRDSDGNFQTEKYVITESIVPRPSLRGRGTVVWRAYKLSDEGVPEAKRQYYAIKDSWRDLHRDRNEGYFFEQIEGLGPKDGVVKFIQFAAVEIGNKTAAKRPDTIEMTVRQGVQGSRGSEFDHRGHVRLLMEEVGVTLDGFASLRELIGVLMDAIQGHRNLMNKNILHRDVSFGNILMTEEIDEELGRRRGYLIDLDFAKDLTPKANDQEDREDAESAKKGKKGKKARVTGTLPFIAIDVLCTDENHRDVHDLESFFWVLLWMCLKYLGPHFNPIKPRPESEDVHPYRALRRLLVCRDLREGGHNKLSILRECQNQNDIADMINPYFHDLIPCIQSLAVIISRGQTRDIDVRIGIPPVTNDERTYDKFLEILKETYDGLPEFEALHVDVETNNLIERFKQARLDSKLDAEEEEQLFTDRDQSLGSFEQYQRSRSYSRPATPTRGKSRTTRAPPAPRAKAKHTPQQEPIFATGLSATQPAEPIQRMTRSRSRAAAQVPQGANATDQPVEGGSKPKTTKSTTKKR